MDLKLIFPVIVAIVPLSLWALKQVVTMPKWLLPLLAPLLGALADVIAAYALNTPTNPVLGAALGALGVWLREVIDQLRKAQA